MSNVEEAVRMWEMFRAGTISELENIPEDQFDYRAGDGARTVRDLALHILGAATGFVNELVSDEPAFMRLRDPNVQAALMKQFGDVSTKAELIELAKSTAASNAQRLRDNAAKIEAGTMPMGSGEQSRVSGVWFAASHEMYHRGQLTIYARGMGVVPAMTAKIAAMSKK
ncbi:MAG TPA: DinB family protein [Thermoanaerobaculia bacterium]